jgi:hypothetical protein
VLACVFVYRCALSSPFARRYTRTLAYVCIYAHNCGNLPTFLCDRHTLACLHLFVFCRRVPTRAMLGRGASTSAHSSMHAPCTRARIHASLCFDVVYRNAHYPHTQSSMHPTYYGIISHTNTTSHKSDKVESFHFCDSMCIHTCMHDIYIYIYIYICPHKHTHMFTAACSSTLSPLPLPTHVSRTCA